MSTQAKQVLGVALSLSPAERAPITGALPFSLDKPDQNVDEVWAQEAAARIDAAERGEMLLASEEKVFAKYGRRSLVL